MTTAQQLANQRAAQERLAASAQREAAHVRLRDAAADALVWLKLFSEWQAVGRLCPGLTPGAQQENQAILTTAIEALEQALAEE